MTTQYHHDYSAFDQHVLCAPFMVEEMRKRAERVEVRAIATAPYDPNDRDLVHYRDNFEVSSGVRETPTRRAYGRVSNTDDPTSIFVEFGFEGGIDKNGRAFPAFPRHRTLGNALDAAGD